MRASNSRLVNLVINYDALFQRYATAIIHCRRTAPVIVQRVFEDFSNSTNKYLNKDSRQLLKMLIKQACHQWLLEQLLNSENNFNLQISRFPKQGSLTPLAFNSLFAKKPKNPV